MTGENNTWGSKAEVLKRLHAAGFNVPAVYLFTAGDWQKSQQQIIDQCRQRFGCDGKIIVRSSASSEDTLESSFAGAFTSVLDVPNNDDEKICQAVNQVISSYLAKGETQKLHQEQILVQPMIQEVLMSGVLMTRVMDDGSPYYVINYDDFSGKTDTVTSGESTTKTLFVYRDAQDTDFDNPLFRNLIHETRKVEEFFGNDALDLEFCYTTDRELFFLQARPITIKQAWESGLKQDVKEKINKIREYVDVLYQPQSDVAGDTNMLGVMPDWNPAEMIGVTPRPLAASLYRFVITKAAWAAARTEMGYNPDSGGELMVILSGRPYINIRNSFNSLLPCGLSRELSTKIVNAWIERLRENPHSHDKVEFDIAFTILDFDFYDNIRSRYPDSFNQDELTTIRLQYLKLTNRCLEIESSGTLASALDRIEILRLTKFSSDTKNESSFSILSRVQRRLENCRRLGTTPFSIIARHAFIAESFLRSAINQGAITSERVDEFKQSIRTISGEFSEDFSSVLLGKKSQSEFIEKYGHLRPGTYDILSPCYRQRKDQIFGDSPTTGTMPHTEFTLTAEEKTAINHLLATNGITSVDADGLFEYSKRSVAGREYAKFVFTRHISEAIEDLACWGDSLGFTRDDVSWLKIDDILDSLINPIMTQESDHFGILATEGKKTLAAGQSIRLGYLIRSVRDVFVVPQHSSTPTYVTQKRVEAPVRFLRGTDSLDIDLEGHIVCIENADPGYDWLFSRNIAGLITQYGGSNSHMTIRCSEYSLPAAIGCGEALFSLISKSSKCELDAEKNILRPLVV